MAKSPSKAADTFEHDGDKATYNGLSDKRITTDEELIAHCKMDKKIWRVKKWGCGAWTTPVKTEKLVEKNGKVFKLKNPVSVNNWKVWAEFERIIPQVYMDGIKEAFADWIKPLAKPVIRRGFIRKPDPIMCMMGLFDAHFGKLCWGPESGEDSDLELQEPVYANAVDDLLARICPLKPEIIYWPLANDFVHVDNDRNETTRGTRVATDSRHSKIIRTAFRAQVRGLQRAAEIAPVEGFIVPGNHDAVGSQYLGLALDARFHGHDRIKIDLSPMSRKYRRYGVTMLGWVHGDKVKAGEVNKLAGIMHHEQRDNLRGTLYSEWFTGHEHRKQIREDTKQGIVIHTLPSLSATDDYHYDNGFIGARRAAEVYVYEKAGGHCGHWIATARGAA
jgi:hypothetical protein